MTDHALESAFCTAFRAGPEFGGIHFFTAMDGEHHHLPSVTIISRSESLAGSAEVFRSELEIRIESHAKDTTPEDHASIGERIRARLASKSDMLVLLNLSGAVRVCGYSITGSGPEIDDGKFVTTITLKAGYRLLTN